MRSASISLPLNFFLFPLGYLYLKDSRRFVIGVLYVLLQATLFSLIAWLNPKFFPAWLNAPLAFGLGSLVTVFILIDTYVLTRRGGGASTWPVFAKPHAFWFIPVYLIAMGTVGILIEPWEKPFARPHNIPSPSMEPGIQVGDYVLADYLIDRENLKISDIVVHRGTGTNAGKKLIHRIVAIPGDRIQLFQASVMGSNKQTYIVTRYKLNGKTIPLAITGNSKYKLMPMSEHEGLFREGFPEAQYDILDGVEELPLSEESTSGVLLGPDEFFLMGDNRDHSADSRFNGLVHRKNIMGKYMHTYFSFFVPDFNCEVQPPLFFLWRTLTAKKNSPCGSVSIRWEKSGYTAP